MKMQRRAQDAEVPGGCRGGSAMRTSHWFTMGRALERVKGVRAAVECPPIVRKSEVAWGGSYQRARATPHLTLQ